MSPLDFGLAECHRVVDEIADYAPLTLVLGGGEPLWRRDVFDIAQHAKSKGLRVALTTNGTLIDEAMAERIQQAGIERVAISLDGSDAVTHDTFRGHQGAFDSAVRGIRLLKDLGVSTQINTTVSRHNEYQLPGILKLSEELGVDAFHMFLLVPVGCGLTIQDEQTISTDEAERILNWVYDHSDDSHLELRATCAPHYYRIMRQKQAEAAPAKTEGCPAGRSICFVSHLGDVYPCGYLPVAAGNLREDSFRNIWEKAEIFHRLRDTQNLEGKCGICKFREVCSGCRARAYGMTGDYLAEEPFCNYEPRQLNANNHDSLEAH